MKRRGRGKKENGLIIEYRELGTISIDELCQAVITDIKALKDIYGISYVKSARLRLPVTNEYGEHRDVYHPAGRKMLRMDTHHFRPSCKDYEL